MNFLKEHKNIFLFIVIALIAIGGYFFFFKGGGGKKESGVTSETTNKQLEPDAVAAEDEAGSEILSLLLRMRSIELGKDLFKKDTFKSLKDFSVELEPRPKGRTNPFGSFEGSEDSENSEGKDNE